MPDKPDEPLNLMDLPLPLRSNAPVETQDAATPTSETLFTEPPTIVAPKSSAQRQREYRQRIAVTRTPAQWAVTRISDTERKHNYRLRKAANLALVSGSLESTTASSSQPPTITAPKSSAQRQREYRQRIAVSRTPAQWAAIRKAETERKRNYRLRKAAKLALDCGSLESTTASSSRSAGRSNNVQNSTQRQLTNQQRQTLAAELAQTTVQLETPFAEPPTIAAPKSSAQRQSGIETSRATMADNIVIEEHDILNHPHVKKLFPDITNLKTEVNFDEDDAGIETSRATMADNIVKEEPDILDHPHVKKIFPDITNLKTEVIFNEDDEELETKPEYIVDQIPNFCQNKIIKSEPCPSDSSLEDEDEKVSKLLPSDVVLENWGIILADSQRYCNTCELLFSSKNEFDFHNMTRHTFPKAVTNEATESKIEITIIKNEPDVDTVDDNLCKHCNVVFPDEVTLLKHLHEFVPKEFACGSCDLVPLTGTACKLNNIEQSQAKYYRCPICSCSYKYMYKLRRHMADHHHTGLPKSLSRVSYNYECVFCVAKFENNTKYNEHIINTHREMFHKTAHNNENDKCFMCKIQFPCK